MPECNQFIHARVYVELDAQRLCVDYFLDHAEGVVKPEVSLVIRLEQDPKELPTLAFALFVHSEDCPSLHPEHDLRTIVGLKDSTCIWKHPAGWL